MDKPAHVERMETEFTDLKDKVTKLESFITNNSLFLNLSKQDQALMRTQESAMKAYMHVLAVRIARATSN